MQKLKFKKLGIKRKVLLGCIVLAIILFFSTITKPPQKAPT